MKLKSRLDVAVQKLYPHFSRQQIQSFILQGKVLVNDQPNTKAGTSISSGDHIRLIAEIPPFVSRSGIKLCHALDAFSLEVKNLIVLDAGISTGGFTDCLLQRGAQKVYGIDVGYGQTHQKIRNDPRVILHEKTNLRLLKKEIIGELVDLVTLDLSFISILKVLDVVYDLLKQGGILITLIKPQFEAQKHDVGTGGIIRDEKKRNEIVQHVIQGITKKGFIFRQMEESIIQGTDGNKECVAYFTKAVDQ